MQVVRITARFALAVWTAGAFQACAADVYPSRPMRLVAPFSAGGTLDVMLRLVAQKLGQGLGTSVVIDNRPNDIALNKSIVARIGLQPQ